MEFEELTRLIGNEIKPKLESSNGLCIFAKERAKFEGWLKVELCDTLAKYFRDVIPEKDRIDVTFSDWAVQLKTPNTNIRYDNVEKKHRPITKNTKGIIGDIKKLGSVNYANKAILFVVFPVTHDNDNWQIQLNRIVPLLHKLEHVGFNFKNGIPGVLYLGLL